MRHCTPVNGTLQELPKRIRDALRLLCEARWITPARNDVGGGRQTAPVAEPSWDSESRELRCCGELVKGFKWPAVNQELVLAAFQEQGWPRRVDDPLPQDTEQDSKCRLSDTIKFLNRKQVHPLIRFHGDGTGEGITWELIGCGALKETKASHLFPDARPDFH